MSGYFGYAMSNNACMAYDEGKMPLSNSFPRASGGDPQKTKPKQ